jgi:hypothetical protein
LPVISNSYTFASHKQKTVSIKQTESKFKKMELEQRKKLYEELREFENGVKDVSNALTLTPNHIRMVMTRFEKHKSVDSITLAVLAEIKKRRAEQTQRLRANFPELL